MFQFPSASAQVQYVKDSITSGLGIYDYSEDEVAALMVDPAMSLYQYADMISRRSQTGWSTHGHSAADVNIYSSDPVAARALVGNHENTEVGDFLREYLGVDVEAVTKELQEKGASLMVTDAEGKEVSWMGEVADEGTRLDGQNHLATYTGDRKKRHLDHGRACDCGH
jgi:alkaline phosphatase